MAPRHNSLNADVAGAYQRREEFCGEFIRNVGEQIPSPMVGHHSHLSVMSSGDLPTQLKSDTMNRRLLQHKDKTMTHSTLIASLVASFLLSFSAAEAQFGVS